MGQNRSDVCTIGLNLKNEISVILRIFLCVTSCNKHRLHEETRSEYRVTQRNRKILTSKELIEQSLKEANHTRENVAKIFLHLSSEELNRKPTPDSWSAAECFQHLLSTKASYLISFGEIIKANQGSDKESTAFIHSANQSFNHSFWGKLILYFVNPKTKMKSKTTSSFNPSNSKVEPEIIQKYLEQHDQLTKTISGMKNLDLKRLRMASPINSKIKYNLGDAIRILVLHDKRHIQQAERALGEYYEK
jgi:hypothetical protein